MSKLVLSQESLQNLLQQARLAGNAELVREIEATLATAKTLKSPNSIEDWDDAREAMQAGTLTIRKDSVRKAAELLYNLAETADAQTRDEILSVFSRALRGNGDES